MRSMRRARLFTRRRRGKRTRSFNTLKKRTRRFKLKK